MDKRLTELFLYELKEQCNFAIQAYKDFIDAYNSKNMTRLWMSLELFLIASAKIPVIFWPQRSKYDKRGEELRNLLSVNTDVQFKTREHRNHLQHFDERLEEWYSNSPNGNIVDKIVLPETSFIKGANFDYLRTSLSKKTYIQISK